MDLPHLVHTVAGRLLRSPAIHYAVLGAVLFATLSPRGPAPPTARLVIPASRIETALREYEDLKRQRLTPEEGQSVIELLVD